MQWLSPKTPTGMARSVAAMSKVLPINEGFMNAAMIPVKILGAAEVEAGSGATVGGRSGEVTGESVMARLLVAAAEGAKEKLGAGDGLQNPVEMVRTPSTSSTEGVSLARTILRNGSASGEMGSTPWSKQTNVRSVTLSNHSICLQTYLLEVGRN